MTNPTPIADLNAHMAKQTARQAELWKEIDDAVAAAAAELESESAANNVSGSIIAPDPAARALSTPESPKQP